MQDAIVFLGTGKGGVVAGKQLRATGGIILILNGNQFLLDPGPGCLIMAKECKVNLRDTVGVVVTHHHIGHCNDLNAVIDAMTYSGIDRKGVLIAPNIVINGDDNTKPYLTAYHRNLLEKIIVVAKDRRAAINDVEIQVLPTKHSHEDAVGFKFISPNVVITYSGDTAYSKEAVDSYKDTDILILNVSDVEKNNKNLSVVDAEKIIETVNPKLAILTHFGMHMLSADPIHIARDIQKKTKVQTLAAKDGMIIAPGNYAAHSTQKRLKSF